MHATRKMKLPVPVRQEDDRVDCPCRKTKCEFHGRCEACRARHYAKNGLPACERSRGTGPSRVTTRRPA